MTWDQFADYALWTKRHMGMIALPIMIVSGFLYVVVSGWLYR
jgi:hypothetical protein